MATLIIWNNHYYPFSAYPGHAALNITNNWSLNNQAADYVSWWPDDGEKIKPGSGPNPSIGHDLAAEGYAPDHILSIQGLDAMAMQAKWNKIRTDPNGVYRLLRKNCSTIAAQVLKAGSPLGSAMERNNLVWTPLKCLRLGLAMGGKEMRWTTFLSELNKGGYLTKSDVAVLSHLYKRDEKHGKNATANHFYYSGGRSVNPKQFLMFQGHAIGKAKAGMTIFQSHEGSLLSSNVITAIENNQAILGEDVGFSNRKMN